MWRLVSGGIMDPPFYLHPLQLVMEASCGKSCGNYCGSRLTLYSYIDYGVRYGVKSLLLHIFPQVLEIITVTVNFWKWIKMIIWKIGITCLMKYYYVLIDQRRRFL